MNLGEADLLGSQLDATANAAGKTLISESGSRVAYVIPTDEELDREASAVLSAPSDRRGQDQRLEGCDAGPADQFSPALCLPIVHGRTIGVHDDHIDERASSRRNLLG